MKGGHQTLRFFEHLFVRQLRPPKPRRFAKSTVRLDRWLPSANVCAPPADRRAGLPQPGPPTTCAASRFARSASRVV